MSELAELERRITSALERIGRGVETLKQKEPEVDTAASDTLQQALDDEKIANAQLTERVAALKEKQETTIAGLQAQVTALRVRAEEAEAGLAEAKSNAEDASAALAKAEEGASAAADTSALEAELAALKKTREEDRAEMDALLADLKNVVEGEGDA